MKEIETKILDIDVEEIRKKLSCISAVLVKRENQINNIFDFSDKRLLNKKGYARIRVVKDLINNCHHYYMTLKEMVSQEKYKIMNEYEIEISNSEEGMKIFTALGLELIQSVEKYRESYKFKNTLIEIDINDKSFVPFPYIEIESPDEDELKEVVELLGYKLSDTSSKTIYEILGNKGVKGL